MKAAEIRKSFLEFYRERGHTVVPSSSLVPANDPTLFFTNAGMVQFKDVFTGAEKRAYNRATTVQKCMRVSGKHNDLENVGFTARHHTLFEMLGNFSFGDYFKEDAIAFAWDYLTRVIGLPSDRLFVSVYEKDDEAAAIWARLGLPAERIGRGSEKDNFWSMGPTGPCGPCTEIFWDLQSDFVLDHEPDMWGFGQDAGRYMEIWNNVFMQFERYDDGGTIRQRPLPRPSVDTGMGLERLAAIAQGKKSNWEIDEFQDLITTAGRIAGVSYGHGLSSDVSLRVVADHARAAAFLVGDGVMPSNEERGYVLRRIMRRAIRHGVKLGIQEPFLHTVAAQVSHLMAGAYPELKERAAFITKVVLHEERTFRQTLTRGLGMLDETFAALTRSGETHLDGAVVFQLHDTFGFPPDLTSVIASERGFHADLVGYQQHMAGQKARSRSKWVGSGERAVEDVYRTLEVHGPTLFLGHQTLEADGSVLAVLVDGVPIGSAAAGTEVEWVTERTPFYAESGGQVGDTGWVVGEGLRVTVLDTQKPAGSVVVHRGRIEDGVLCVGETVHFQVDAARRLDTMRNHTATHLLHAALREVLGDHVQQKGSQVGPDRLRFDFSHFEPLTEEQRLTIEDRVNDRILADVHTIVGEHALQDAQHMGAIALFGEKYGDRVRVVQVPGFSTEFCGGTHCGSTGQVGMVKIVAEGGIAAGIRRIEALSGRGVLEHLRTLEGRQASIVRAFKARPEDWVEKVERLVEERRALKKEVEELKQQVVAGGAGAGPQAIVVGGWNVLCLVLDGVDGKALRGHADTLLDKVGPGVVVLGAVDGEKTSLLVKVSKELEGSIHAGDLVRELAPLIGGTGGGRPDMAQAGGRDASGLPGAILRARALLSERLSLIPPRS